MDDQAEWLPPQDAAVVRTWAVGRFSFFGSITPIYLMTISTALIVAGIYLLVADESSSQRFGFVWLLFVGCVWLVVGVFLFETVARRVEALANGHYRFSSRRRSVVVDPTNIISMRGLGWAVDFWGMYPFRLRTGSGSLLVDRHMRDGTTLEYELRRANPRMAVKRAWGPERS